MKSMTGFGKGQFYDSKRKYIVEIKSVNSKYLDISVRLPKLLAMFEEDIRKRVASCISRGKLDITVTFENYSQVGKKVFIDENFLAGFLNEIQSISEKLNIENDIKMSNILQMDGAISFVQDTETENELKVELMLALDNAIENFVTSREIEGNQISQDIAKKLENFQTNVELIEKLSYNIVEEYKDKIENRLQNYIHEQDIDKNRILTEIVIFADKMTIDEEIIRLKSHILQFKSEIDSQCAVGKKLDFIVQEMNRETNTIGSKSNNVNITECVILNKAILENIREQIQNIE